MKESLWGYWIVILGISIIAVMMLLQSYTTTSEQDYYLMKEVMEAAMYDAVDYGYYRETGELTMNTEKFVENYIRRFADTVNINKNYKIDFYDIYEQPPAASIAIITRTNDTNFGKANHATEEQEVINRLTGILYTNTAYTPENPPDYPATPDPSGPSYTEEDFTTKPTLTLPTEPPPPPAPVNPPSGGGGGGGGGGGHQVTKTAAKY